MGQGEQKVQRQAGKNYSGNSKWCKMGRTGKWGELGTRTPGHRIQGFDVLGGGEAKGNFEREREGWLWSYEALSSRLDMEAPGQRNGRSDAVWKGSGGKAAGPSPPVQHERANLRLFSCCVKKPFVPPSSPAFVWRL